MLYIRADATKNLRFNGFLIGNNTTLDPLHSGSFEQVAHKMRVAQQKWNDYGSDQLSITHCNITEHSKIRNPLILLNQMIRDPIEVNCSCYLIAHPIISIIVLLNKLFIIIQNHTKYPCLVGTTAMNLLKPMTCRICLYHQQCLELR